MNILIWIGICFCISQSAMFSGLNLAFFSITRLRLEVEAANKNKAAIKVLKMRSDSNFLLTTILWGNVGINVLLTLLSNSVMTGVAAFVFSTIIMTFLGEIVPQAYFSRHALKMASSLAPMLKFYQIVLYPVAKPSARFLDLWLGHEGIQYYKEKALKQLIREHVKGDGDVDHIEGIGAINFLSIDDLFAEQEGERIDPKSVIPLHFHDEKPIFPKITNFPDDLFIHKIHQSKKNG
jgi:metal transporter CNNM